MVTLLVYIVTLPLSFLVYRFVEHFLVIAVARVFGFNAAQWAVIQSIKCHFTECIKPPVGDDIGDWLEYLDDTFNLDAIKGRAFIGIPVFNRRCHCNNCVFAEKNNRFGRINM
tara:strand:- start:162 stop:500 length:339 start_codon:yes stop_codon:yes gene_type:complete